MKFKEIGIQFPGKKAIITGASGGLGFALTELLINDGWTVFGIDLQTESLEKLASPFLKTHKLDITKTEEYLQLLRSICEQNEIDILFNNAGVGEGVTFEDYTIENWDWVININLKAVIVGCHEILPYFKKRNTGIIVNIASAAGFANLPNMSPYNVTKAAVISLSETLAHELSLTNIKVKCVTPTFFRSGILQHSKGDQQVLASARNIVDNSKLTSNDAAYIILSTLHNKQEVIRFPFSSTVLFQVKRFFPSLFRWLVRKYLVK